MREATAILWMLQSLGNRLRPRVVAFTDSRAACGAIRRGSRSRPLQAIVRRIFVWCVNHGVTLFPCWVPRSAKAIAKADEWSRIRDYYGLQTPANVFAEADRLARVQWGAPLSFDRMATHLNAMPPRGWGPQLPFNSLFVQPGSHGVDMFLQPRSSWQRELNFVHPPEPAIGRVLTFLPSVAARAVVVFPANFRRERWWTNLSRVGSPGVVSSSLFQGFLIIVIDHSWRYLHDLPNYPACMSLICLV